MSMAPGMASFSLRCYPTRPIKPFFRPLKKVPDTRRARNRRAQAYFFQHAVNGPFSADYMGKNFLRVPFRDLQPILVRQPLDRLKDRHDVLEVAPGLGIDGVDRAEHLRGEEQAVGADAPY